MSYLMHHGVKGQKWGVRRYQNEDGSYTDLGKKRYGIGERIKNKWNSLSDTQKSYVKVGASIAAIALLNYGYYKLVAKPANERAKERYRQAQEEFNRAHRDYYERRYRSRGYRSRSSEYGRKVADDIFGKYGHTNARTAAKAPSVEEAKKALDEIMRKAAKMEANGGMDIETKEAVINARNVYKAAKKAANGG